MRPTFDLEKIIEAITIAAFDASRWNDAMEILTTCTGSLGAAMFPVIGPLPSVPASRSLEELLDSYVRNGWIHRDERYKGTPKLMREGVFTDFDFTSDDVMKKHPYYQEFLGPFRSKAFVGVRMGNCCFSIQRTVEQGEYSNAELQTFRSLSSQLDGVAAVAEALSYARSDAALSAFELAGRPALFIDAFGNVVRKNAAAEKLLGQDIQLVNRKLASWDREATNNLNKALNKLVWSRSASTVGPVAFPRHDAAPVAIYGIRTPSLTDIPFSEYCALLLLVDMEGKSNPSVEALRSLFGFTTAEAKLANALAKGVDLAMIADQFGISKDTVRNQLKSVFSKTGTHRQLDLVSMLSNLLPER